MAVLGTVAAVGSSCSRNGCQRPGEATLVYDYAAGVATLGPLAAPHPMQYDVCAFHADRLSVPRGWVLDDQRVSAVVLDLTERRAG